MTKQEREFIARYIHFGWAKYLGGWHILDLRRTGNWDRRSIAGPYPTKKIAVAATPAVVANYEAALA